MSIKQDEPYYPSVGDIIEATMGSAVHRYEVFGCHIGAVDQESLIEVESISHKAGWTGQWEYHPRLWLPLWSMQYVRKVT